MKLFATAVGVLVGIGAWAAEPRPAVLVTLTHNEGFDRLDPELVRRLLDAGFEIDAMDVERLTWERLRQFNVVVMLGNGVTPPDYQLTPAMRAREEMLARFAAAGGGVWLDPWTAEGTGHMPAIWSLLGRWGANVFLEEIRDPRSEQVATGWSVRFAYTANVAPHPITQGVAGIWYPTVRLKNGCGTLPIGVGEGWQIILRGEAASTSAPYETTVPAIDGRRRAQGYASAVPLAAAREVEGGGRLFLFALYPTFSFCAPFDPILEQISIEKGLGAKRSDLFRLFVNALHWLAEPSLGKGQLGGAATPRETLLANPAVVKREAPIDWPKLSFGPPKRQFPGLIGARTQLSGGQGSVADHVAAAKAAGLSWLAFLEDGSKITPEALAQLKADCKAASDDGFLAVPGIEMRDIHDGSHFYLGPFVDLPGPKLLDPATRRFARLAEPDAGLGTSILNYVITQVRMEVMAGSFWHNRGKYPSTDYRDYDVMAIVTESEGKLVEDAVEDYIYLQKRGESLLPVSVHRFDASAGIAEAAKSYRTVFQAADLAALRREFATWHMLDDPHAYVTNGPQIAAWDWIGPRDYSNIYTKYDDTFWRWRVRFIVEADAGVKEVRIFDGPGNLFRRFLGKGEKRLERILELHHGQQKNLVLLVEDAAGRRAISGDAFDRSHLFEEFMCGDRNNQLLYSAQRRETGPNAGLRFQTGFGCGVTPNKGPWGGEISTAVFKWDPVMGGQVQGFDGSPYGEPAFFLRPELAVEEKGRPLHCRPIRRLCSSDVMIGEGHVDGTFALDGPRPTNVWHTLEPVLPPDQLEGYTRTTHFLTQPDGLSATIWECDFVTRVPLTPKKGAGLLVNFAYMQARTARAWTVRLADGTALSGQRKQGETKDYRALPFGQGAYLAACNSRLGGSALYSLTDGLTVTFPLPSFDWAFVGLADDAIPGRAKGQPIPAGTPLRAKLLLIGTPWTMGQTTEPFEQVRNLLAFQLFAAGYNVERQAGTLEEARLWLKADGEGKGFSARVARSAVPVNLPILVSGLNNRWSVYLYEARGGERGQARPVGIDGGTAYATVDPTQGDLSLSVAHPITCDKPALWLTVVPKGDGTYLLDVHNPTDAPLTARFAISPLFPLLAPGEFELAIPAGDSVVRDLPAAK